jgi:hypothetical protein
VVSDDDFFFLDTKTALWFWRSFFFFAAAEMFVNYICTGKQKKRSELWGSQTWCSATLGSVACSCSSQILLSRGWAGSGSGSDTVDIIILYNIYYN